MITAKKVQSMISSSITKKCLWKTSWIVSFGFTYCEKKRASNLFMVRSEVFLIQKSSDKKSKKRNYEANSRKCERIEKLIICPVELSVYIPESHHMYHNLDERRYPEYLSVYTIEYNQEYKIQKREKCHKSDEKSIVRMIWILSGFTSKNYFASAQLEPVEISTVIGGIWWSSSILRFSESWILHVSEWRESS